MSRSEAQSRFLPAQAAPFLCGIASAVTLFLLLLRLEVAGPAPVLVPGLGLAAALAGVVVGVAAGAWTWRGTPARRLVPGAAAVAAWAALALLWGGDWLLLAAGGLLGFGALVASSGPRVLSGGAALVAGALVGFLVCTVGLVAGAGVAAAVVPLVTLAAVAGLLSGRRGEGERSRTGAWDVSPALLLAASAGAAVALLVRNYLPVTASSAYAAADLGIAFAAGLLLRRRALRGGGAAASDLATGAAGVAVLVCINTVSFILYTDLVASGSAAYQTPAHLLTAGRVFPFWIIALGLGALSAPAWTGPGALLAAAAGAAAAGLLGASYAGPALVAVLLCLCCCGVGARRAKEGTLVFRVGTVGLAAGALLTLAALDAHAGWPGVRATVRQMALKEERTVERLRVGPGEFGPHGLSVRFELEGRAGAVWNGQVLEAAGLADGAGASVRLLTGLGLAAAPPNSRVAVLGPPLEETVRGLAILTRQDPPAILDNPGSKREGAYGLIVCGPGALGSMRNPLALLGREGLERVRQNLSPDGILALWLPLGRMSGDAARRTLATVDRVFGAYDVYVSGPEAVVLAGQRPAPRFADLRAYFAEEAAEAWMRDGGYWEGVELLADFAAGAQDLRAATQMAGVLSLSAPGRPRRSGRDLSDPGTPAAPALVLQYRLMGPDRLLRRVSFESESQKRVALRGFAAYYRAMTRRLLQRLPGDEEERPRQLVAFLGGPYARLDLLAPEADTRPMQFADALFAFGMPEQAVAVLQQAIDAGRDSFALRSRLGRALADAHQYREALDHYRRALGQRPDCTDTMRSIAALQLQTGAFREGAATLRRLIEHSPDSVVDMMMLAKLRMRMGDMAEARRLAERVLEHQPEHPDAHALIELTRQREFRQREPEPPAIPLRPQGEP